MQLLIVSAEKSAKHSGPNDLVVLMATVRDIITHVEIEVAVRTRICHHNRQEHEIMSGQKCLVIREHDGSRKNYCLDCSKAILVKAKNKLSVLERDIQV
jgi:hypothetical protein